MGFPFCVFSQVLCIRCANAYQNGIEPGNGNHFRFGLCMGIHQIPEKTKYFKKPYNGDNHNNNVENVFDFVIHRDICIDSPQEYTYNNKNKKDR